MTPSVHDGAGMGLVYLQKMLLVGGLVAMNFIFPYIGFLIIPIDFHIFQRGGPTTNQSISSPSTFIPTKFPDGPMDPMATTDPMTSTATYWALHELRTRSCCPTRTLPWKP